MLTGVILRRMNNLALWAGLLLFACGAEAGGDILGDAPDRYFGICYIPTEIEQRRERYAADSCWRVEVAESFGLTERGGSCKDAPQCLVTHSTAVDRHLLDWGAEGEDNPVTWNEVSCEERCDN